MKIFTLLTTLILTLNCLYAQDNVKPEMVLVEGGTFKMGNDFTANADERPAHQITLNSFYMSKKEINNEQYTAFCLAIGKKKPMGENDEAVIGIKWSDAVMYCNWLSSLENFDPAYTIRRDSGKVRVTLNPDKNGYRLPTEAEWEYAAKGGKKSKHYAYSGSNVPSEIAWFISNASNKRHKTGLKKPNELGLYDMTGNILEWCYDWYGDEYYKSSEASNPIGPTNGVNRVCRGGNFMCRSEVLRNSKRFSINPDDENGLTGIRLVRNAN